MNEYQLILNKVDNELVDVNNRLKTIKIIPYKLLVKIKEKINKFDSLKSLIGHLKEIKEEVINVDEKLASIILPKINLKDLKVKIETLEKLVKLKIALEESEENKGEIVEELNNVIESIKKESKEYKGLLKKIGVCPVCKQKLDEKVIEEIKL